MARDWDEEYTSALWGGNSPTRMLDVYHLCGVRQPRERLALAIANMFMAAGGSTNTGRMSEYRPSTSVNRAAREDSTPEECIAAAADALYSVSTSLPNASESVLACAMLAAAAGMQRATNDPGPMHLAVECAMVLGLSGEQICDIIRKHITFELRKDEEE